jgi:DNA recombination protein RmuC
VIDLAFGVAAGVGAVAVAFVVGGRLAKAEERSIRAATEKELDLSRARLDELRLEAQRAKQASDTNIAKIEAARARAETERRDADAERQKALVTRAELAAELQALRDREAERVAWLTETTTAMNDRFEAVASRIVDERAARVDGKLKDDLAALLTPMGEKLAEFRTRVDSVHLASSEAHATLREQLRHVLDLNKTLAAEAHALTAALKGSVQTQGAWGEIILDRVLEASGLRRGEEYLTQQSHKRADGTVARPDAELRLPDGRWVVIDAKVSLLAWDAYVAAETEGDRRAALNALTQSVRAHLKGLVPRDYAAIHRDRGVDFVILFVPIEAAFSTIIGADPDLARAAWEGDVLLASPSTLLFVLRTVAHLWRTERQELNAKQIADRGAELYDKLVGFVTDLEKVGTAIDSARSTFDGALSKLSSGKGNAIRQAEMLRSLGVKPKKQLPAGALAAAFADDADDRDPVNADGERLLP